LNLFLIGAGFNIDATLEASPVIGAYHHDKIDCGYPLVADVLRLCFGLEELPAGKSVEDLFSDAKRNDNSKPMDVLGRKLMDADGWIARKLAFSSASNSYQKFFEKFSDTHFLTFNYDSLPEIFLSRLGRWYAKDGYGVPVETQLRFGVSLPPNAKSTSWVLHLHGSSCVYTTEFDIVGNPFEVLARLEHREARHEFDPLAISDCFTLYGRMMSNTGFVSTGERVIAPLPDKSPELNEVFPRQTYAKALPLVHEAGTLVAVGYSFSVHDRVSYDPILQALMDSTDRTLFIVSPQAHALAVRIGQEYPRIEVKPIEKTFGMWATDDFSPLRGKQKSSC
jgi:hypothetical protein